MRPLSKYFVCFFQKYSNSKMTTDFSEFVVVFEVDSDEVDGLQSVVKFSVVVSAAIILPKPPPQH